MIVCTMNVANKLQIKCELYIQHNVCVSISVTVLNCIEPLDQCKANLVQLLIAILLIKIIQCVEIQLM